MVPAATSTPAVESEGKADVKNNFEDLIETVISTIQKPEVTEAGVAAVMAKLEAYSAGINQLIDALPPDTANANGISTGVDAGSAAGVGVTGTTTGV